MKSLRKIFCLAVAGSMFLSLGRAGASSAVVTDGGKSDFVIYHTANAQRTVRDAASEIQRIIEVSSGVRLPIVTEPKPPMIALGETDEARSLGLIDGTLPLDGFRVVSSGSNIVISGRDIPPGQEKWHGQTSRGTWNGAMAFLEEAVGVRWLLPGPEGEDVPRLDRIAVISLDLRKSPGFEVRCLSYVYNKEPEVVAWTEHNKIHAEHRRLSFGHAWDEHPSLEVLQEHSEYMVMRDDGQRQPVPPKKDHSVGYCLTQPGLLQAYADSLMADFADPKLYHGSMSSSDGYTGCACPECAKLIAKGGSEWNEFGGYGHSISPLMMNFYEGVARLVGEKYPDRIVGGYIYRNYLYPVPPPAVPIPNLHLEIAILNAYGYKFFKPQRAEELKPLVEGWSKVARHIGFSDYSTWMRNGFGVPLPPGRSILKVLFPVMASSKAHSVIYTGHEAWGTGAFHNYVVSRLLWDPGADVDALCTEFLDRAYGKDAGQRVGRIYQLIEDQMAEYIRSFGNRPRDPSYNVDYEFISNVCAPHLAAIEKLYLEAAACDLTDAQRVRLSMFRDGLTVLHFNMRKAELAGKTPENSPFYKSDADYRAFLAGHEKSIVLDKISKPGEDGTLKVLSPPDGRKAVVPQLMTGFQPPKIDGTLDDPAWEEAVEISGFRTKNERSPAKILTKVKMIRDGDALYLGVECTDPDLGAIKAASSERDKLAIFEDETFEIFIAHPKDPKRSYWHLAVSPTGAVYDAIANNAVQNLDFVHGTSRIPTGWTAEIAIPFAKLGMAPASEGSSWRVNFGRSRKGAEPETSSWNGVDRGFHEPHNFGSLEFPPGKAE